jgi:hypothetical protein
MKLNSANDLGLLVQYRLEVQKWPLWNTVKVFTSFSDDAARKAARELAEGYRAEHENIGEFNL